MMLELSAALLFRPSKAKIRQLDHAPGDRFVDEAAAF
jgi:hypothetical protein